MGLGAVLQVHIMWFAGFATISGIIHWCCAFTLTIPGKLQRKQLVLAADLEQATPLGRGPIRHHFHPQASGDRVGHDLGAL